MKNNEDYIYEYSDLNLFHTRVRILTGRYKDVILEFGGSLLKRWYDGESEEGNEFKFEYTLYEKPENLMNYKLKGAPEFEDYLCNLLINIIDDRKKDPDEKRKLMQASSIKGVQNSKIKIDRKWYIKR
jgi:hypothetical protein